MIHERLLPVPCALGISISSAHYYSYTALDCPRPCCPCPELSSPCPELSISIADCGQAEPQSVHCRCCHCGLNKGNIATGLPGNWTQSVSL